MAATPTGMAEDNDDDNNQLAHDPPTAHSNPLFNDSGPLADPLERRTIFAALDSF